MNKIPETILRLIWSCQLLSLELPQSEVDESQGKPTTQVSYLILRVFGVSQWNQWYTNIVQGFTNGTNGNIICTNGNANGTIGSPSGTIGINGKPMVLLVSQWYHWQPMVPLVKLPMVPLGEPRTSKLLMFMLTNFNPLINLFYLTQFERLLSHYHLPMDQTYFDFPSLIDLRNMSQKS